MKKLKGRHKVMTAISEELKLQPGKPTVWVNATSLGDFAIAKPLIDRLQGSCNIVITLHRPGGYDPLKREESKYDNVFYLPWDSQQNAKRFLDLVKPSAAVFLEADFLPNYLEELKRRGVATFLVAARADDSSVFSRFGGMHKRDLASFDKIFTIDEATAEKLREMGAKEVIASGDTLFDNAMATSMEPYNNDVVERFKGEKPLFVAGSIHMDDDMELIERLVKEFTDIRFLIVPYEVKPKVVTEIKKRLGLNIPSYSECLESTVLPPANALIVDYVGDLSRLYRYADYAYVGGGFTKHLHSVIEPCAYGIPLAFGPHKGRRAVADEMEEKGIAEKFTTYPQLRIWLSALNSDPEKHEAVKSKAQELFEANMGASDKISKEILDAAKKGPKPKSVSPETKATASTK